MKVIERNFIIFDVETTGLEEDDFAIEIGMIIVDQTFKILDAYSTLAIPPIEVMNRLTENDTTWAASAAEAYAIHKISVNDVLNEGLDYSLLAQRIKQLAVQYTLNKRKPILISDNAYFDTFHFTKIVPNKNQFFHYSTWDTNLMFACAKIADPISAHRALADTFLLYNQLYPQCKNGLFE